MKKLLLSVILATSLAFSSCQFDDSDIWNKFGEMEESIRDHEQRISALEELCKQMNTNISSLQTIVAALQNNDYVTAIVPVIKDGITIGYTITFTKSQPITIYHGEDGKDGANGADGKDGYTPQIGVKQDTDGIYYWTLDGDWLLDASGNKIKAVGTDGKDGQNGADGKDGQDGKDGADGISPQLKIEDGYWYISYDNGTTWTQLGKATGEDGKDGQNGTNGKDGQDGDSFFQSVTQDEEYVYFTLADGTVITLPKYSAETEKSNNKIYYTTSDGNKMFPKTDASLYGAILMSNTYKDGQGVLIFDDTITSIGSEAFSGCTSLTSVTIPDSVTSIGQNAFEDCTSLTSVRIGNGVTSIGSLAFDGCTSLTSVRIGNGVTSIGRFAFDGCTGELTINCNIPGDSFGPDGAFCGSKFTKVTIGNGVTSIGYYAFEYCTSLKEVYYKGDLSAWCKIDFSNSYSNYYSNPCTNGARLFIDDVEVIDITIPSDITEIKAYTFSGCTSLTSITIPDSVTSIGHYAFEDCTSLKEVYCKPTTPPTGGDYMFSNNASGRKIYVPTASVNAYKAASYWSNYADYIVGYDF